MDLTPEIAAEICAVAALPVPPVPLILSPEDLYDHLLEAQKRMAEVAEYHGDQGSFWRLWLATAPSAAALDAAIGRLTGKEGYWCAAWCFEHDLALLGFPAHERYQNEIEPGHSPNPYMGFVYAMEALRHNVAARAFVSLDKTKASAGLDTSDEVFLMILGFASGAIAPSSLLQTLARFGRTEDMLTRLAVAVGHDVVGDRASAENCLAFLHRDTPLAPSILRTLTDRFGDLIVSAMSREPPAMPRRTRLIPGLIAVPGKRRTPHEFAPVLASGIVCRGCGRALRIWWVLDLSSLSMFSKEVRSLGRLPFPACFDCNYWMLTHEYRVGQDGGVELLNIDAESRGLGKAMGDYSMRNISTQPIRFVKAPAKLHELPLDGRCQLGGDPAWIQDAMDPRCPECSAAMTFVFRFSAPNQFVGCPEVAGGSGALYYHVCAGCRQIRCAAQWT